jgi:hypothetical protein
MGRGVAPTPRWALAGGGPCPTREETGGTSGSASACASCPAAPARTRPTRPSRNKAVEDGQAGTVVRRDAAHGGCPHPVLVEFDAPLAWPISVGGVGGTVPLLIQRYAEEELEPLD